MNVRLEGNVIYIHNTPYELDTAFAEQLTMTPLPAFFQAPVATNSDHVEHIDDVFAYFGERQMPLVMRQHANGHRALFFVSKDAACGNAYLQRDVLGSITNAAGAPFFNAALEAQIVESVHEALRALGYFSDAEFVLFEAIIAPYSLQYDVAAVLTFAEHEIAARHAELQLAPPHLKDVYTERFRNAICFEATLHNYHWSFDARTIQIAPLQLVATSRETFFDAPVTTHIDFAKQLAAFAPFVDVPHMLIETEADEMEAIARWTEWSELGVVGAIVETLEPTTRMIVRGREYLRLIYGIDYTAPHELRDKKEARRSTLHEVALQRTLYEEWVQRFLRRDDAHLYARASLALHVQLEEQHELFCDD
ncbi:hypothetical protein [Caryophanon latum]|uniref:Polynucleotide kinase-phosphatase ligase domain-containing protein n=1 Tax=Caryophanon latum TaxID=33977 RepID=A0A1C0Y8F9_9BACL|nr:hypothetical protein [Caryophanon latum]OCS83447.1 hypothetical protein A6K76_03470 [Caryophanon latum]